MPMKTYRTAEVAAAIGVHPNTIRFYEEQGLLPSIPRLKNGYRVFGETHLLQVKLIRLAFQAEILSSNLRKSAIDIVKTAANGNFSRAIEKTENYQTQIKEEIQKALEAITLTEAILADSHKTDIVFEDNAISRREAAIQIGVSMDVLRDWERNGLIEIPRKKNRRMYGAMELNRLKIIAVLRHANYSQMAIRRMLTQLEQGNINLRAVIDTPEDNEDIISVADRYLTSLTLALADTKKMLVILRELR